MTYTLHTWPDSAALIVRLVLEELGIPYTAVTIDRPGGALDSPAYRALQPLGKIPALETPDGPMFETGAILLYLSETHGALAPAPGAPDRAAFLKWFIFVTNEVHPTVMQIFYPDRVAGPEAAPAVTLTATARLRDDLTLLDRMVARDRPAWLSPDAPSILGYYVATLLRWIGTLEPGHPARWSAGDFPALCAVLAALEQRPAARAAAKADHLGPTIFTNPT
ncbi:MAG: glutathione S-transferase family protein [Pseudomonadota bacterium]